MSDVENERLAKARRSSSGRWTSPTEREAVAPSRGLRSILTKAAHARLNLASASQQWDIAAPHVAMLTGATHMRTIALRWRRPLAGWLVAVALGIPLPAAALAQATDARGLARAAAAMEPVAPNAPAGNAALFVGVNHFPEDPSLTDLRFAVDDAVAQAHLFCLELRLVAPENCVLALGGEPTTDDGRRQLAELRQAKVEVVDATRTRVMHKLAGLAAVPRTTADLLVVSLSSHGFEQAGTPYVLPADGSHADLGEDGISLTWVQSVLGASRAGKRLLLIDACREKTFAQRGDGSNPMDGAFHAALGRAQGQAELTSCGPGQVSYESEELGHGVFTWYLMQALRGRAAADGRGFVTLGAVSQYVSTQVKAWVERSRPGTDASRVQVPDFSGPEDARAIPLAVNPGVKADLAQLEDALKARIDRHGPFTFDLYDRLCTALEAAVPGDPATAELVASARDFADGRTRPAMFATYLNATLKPPATPKVVDGKTTAPDAGPQQGGATSRPATDASPTVAAAGTVPGSDQTSAAHGESPRAMALRAVACEREVPPDFAGAMRWYRRAADAGDGFGMAGVGALYHRGLGVPRDYAEAVRWYRKGADAGDPTAMASMGVVCEQGLGVAIDYAAAMRWYRKGADAGSGLAMCGIGSLYQGGLGVTPDLAQAVAWYRKGAAVGDGMSMCFLGLMYQMGTGVAPDMAEALRWYRKGAGVGNGLSISLVGWTYKNGLGVPPDDAEAIKWFRQGAALGDGSGMLGLATLYEEGSQVPQDINQAMKWVRAGAEAGDFVAMYKLADYYERGVGTTADHAMARQWMQRAGKAGNPGAADWLATHP
jgi:TPR repeat protein